MTGVSSTTRASSSLGFSPAFAEPLCSEYQAERDGLWVPSIWGTGDCHKYFPFPAWKEEARQARSALGPAPYLLEGGGISRHFMVQQKPCHRAILPGLCVLECDCPATTVCSQSPPVLKPLAGLDFPFWGSLVFSFFFFFSFDCLFFFYTYLVDFAPGAWK